MKRQKAIAACCERGGARRGIDGDDVLECLYASYPQEVAGYSTNLARAALRQQVTIQLERRSGLDPLQPYP